MADQVTSNVAVFVEPTPNPNSLKFVVGKKLVERGPYEFANPAEAEKSPLAQQIFAISGVEGVFVGSDFVTIRKSETGAWDEIEQTAISIIEKLVSDASAVIVDETDAVAATESGEEPAEAKVIRQILDEEIRPAVASDGGDVQFQTYIGGVLTLKLVGACSGCPSSLMTLKMGIERRLREDVPELLEVVAAP